eukprot:610337-Pyramimonas_sp.AAC.1
MRGFIIIVVVIIIELGLSPLGALLGPFWGRPGTLLGPPSSPPRAPRKFARDIRGPRGLVGFAGKILRLYDKHVREDNREDGPHKHPLVMKLFSPGPGLDAVKDFINGSEPSPILERIMAQLRFISVIEVPAERVHAVISKSIRVAPNHGPVHVALSQHAPLIEDWLKQYPEKLGDFGALLDTVRRPIDCIRVLGFSMHPGVVHMRSLVDRESKLNRNPWSKKLVRILYHCDSGTLFQNYVLRSADAPGDGGSGGGGDGSQRNDGGAGGHAPADVDDGADDDMQEGSGGGQDRPGGESGDDGASPGDGGGPRGDDGAPPGDNGAPPGGSGRQGGDMVASSESKAGGDSLDKLWCALAVSFLRSHGKQLGQTAGA